MICVRTKKRKKERKKERKKGKQIKEKVKKIKDENNHDISERYYEDKRRKKK